MTFAGIAMDVDVCARASEGSVPKDTRIATTMAAAEKPTAVWQGTRRRDWSRLITSILRESKRTVKELSVRAGVAPQRRTGDDCSGHRGASILEQIGRVEREATTRAPFGYGHASRAVAHALSVNACVVR